MGSYLGGCLSILILVGLACYLGIMFFQMLAGDNDIINETRLTNTFDEDSRSVEINDFAFLPYVHIERQRYDINMNLFDIWEDGDTTFSHINAKKLMNYVDIQLHKLRRTSDNFDNIYIPFRRCTHDDFKSRNYTLEANDSDLNYLCPNMTMSDSLRIESKYTNTTFRESFSIEMLRCNRDLNPNCKNETEQR